MRARVLDSAICIHTPLRPLLSDSLCACASTALRRGFRNNAFRLEYYYDGGSVAFYYAEPPSAAFLILLAPRRNALRTLTSVLFSPTAQCGSTHLHTALPAPAYNSARSAHLFSLLSKLRVCHGAPSFSAAALLLCDNIYKKVVGAFSCAASPPCY